MLEADHEPAAKQLREAIGGSQDLGYIYWLAVTQLDLAECLIAQGSASEAEALLSDATAVLTELRARPALERAAAIAAAAPPAVQSTV